MPAAQNYGRSVRVPGQETSQSLATLLDVQPEDAKWLKDEFEKIRQAELAAERIASTIRLY